MIDVDRFKSYNDLYGHLAGDECLRAVARALKDMQQRSTDLVVRYGGEEFVVLLPGTTLQGAVIIAETIQMRIRALHENPENRLHCPVAVSIGCAALVPAADRVPNELIGASDEALYRAKQNGRNRVEAA
jgi:diguanylate cyclase (GGDEF)-like protein